MLGRKILKTTTSKYSRLPAATSKEHKELNLKYMAQNFIVMEPVIARGERCWLYDVDGKKYLDFHSGYCSVNQGHCHPKIVETLMKQAKLLTIPSRAFDNDKAGPFAELVCKTFGYDKILPSNGGVEACESALKLARRWGYEVKGVPDNKAEFITANGCFWGRTLAAISGCNDPARYHNFGPLAPGFSMIPFNDLDALEKLLESNPNIVAYMVEPIQGEAGVIIPDKGYLSKAQKLLNKHNCLMIVDEIQTGLGRTGRMLCSHHEKNFRPDIVTLGKSISGGMMPLSLILADKELMDLIKPGEHGSTFGGNALACAVGKTALEVIIEEELCERSAENGLFLLKELKKLESKLIKETRGEGLFCSLELNARGIGKKFAMSLNKNGLICKNTHDNIIRFAPPLVISQDELAHGVEIIQKTLKEFE